MAKKSLQNSTIQNTTSLDSKLIPASWHICFNKDCPKKDNCLRFKASTIIPETSTLGPAIYPNAYQNGDCLHFKKGEIVNGAYGISHLFDNVKKCESKAIRAKIVEYLNGETAYYRYNNGIYLLKPEQQEKIKNIFLEHGYTFEIEFKHYKPTFIF